MFALLFKNGDDALTRNSFDEYDMLWLDIKDSNASIENKAFFDQQLKNKQKLYEKLIKMSRNNNFTTGKLLDYLYHQNYYKHIGIDLARQTNTSIAEKNNLAGKLGANNGETMFRIAEKQQKITPNFLLDKLIVRE